LTIKRTVALACLAIAITAAAPTSALAGIRMYMGFQDDPSLRWRDDRAAVFDQAQQANAGIVRTTVYWSRIAPVRPAQAANAFDASYRFDDLDEFVRNAQLRGIEVMLTIWGTPSWANGGRGENRAPSRMQDLQSFTQALSARYSGRFPGYPFVRFFTIWNEPNLGQFLSPTFDANGKPVSPFIYAKLYRAAYAGIKSGNSRALIGVGETSPRGRDRSTPSPGKLQDSLSPGTFARLLAQSKPKIKFTAWAHHPYSSLGAKPGERYRFPNVNLSTLSTFEKKLDEWFGRKNIPIWITEYGFETKPGEPRGVTVSQQASYARTAIQKAEADQRVQIFIWFILRDDPTSAWQSGLLNRDGQKKPAYGVFAALAREVDGRNPIIRVKVGAVPVLRIPVLELAARNGVGAVVGAEVRMYQSSNGKLVSFSQLAGTIAVDGWTSFVFGKGRVKSRYDVLFDFNDKLGNRLRRTATLIYY
jgi:aryl-phospho-beta-D-glucosidase BglC (GH1 family)